jgi:hypothetical protein
VDPSRLGIVNREVPEGALAVAVTRYMTKVGSAGAREGFLFKNAAARFEVEDD